MGGRKLENAGEGETPVAADPAGSGRRGGPTPGDARKLRLVCELTSAFVETVAGRRTEFNFVFGEIFGGWAVYDRLTERVCFRDVPYRSPGEAADAALGQVLSGFGKVGIPLESPEEAEMFLESLGRGVS